MVWTWKHVFGPAVMFALVGFIALVAHLGRSIVTGASVAGIAIALVYYLLARPKLGVD